MQPPQKPQPLIPNPRKMGDWAAGLASRCGMSAPRPKGAIALAPASAPGDPVDDAWERGRLPSLAFFAARWPYDAEICGLVAELADAQG